MDWIDGGTSPVRGWGPATAAFRVSLIPFPGNGPKNGPHTCAVFSVSLLTGRKEIFIFIKKEASFYYYALDEYIPKY